MSPSGHLTYSIFGLRVASELPLNEIPTADEPAGGVDVRIAFAPIQAAPAPPGYTVSGSGTLLTVPEVARFEIRGGREIVIEPAAGASERNLRLFLLGSAFGALLHQRGLLPLHANAIEVEGRAVAFCGHSGAGKSTIAAWFHDRGHRILADDVCVIGFDGEGAALAYPGIPRLRLWREALEASGRTAEDYHRSFDDLDKYDVPTTAEGSLAPLKLAAIYHLRKAPEGVERPEIVRLQGVESVDTLVANTYRGAYLKELGRTGEHLAACVRIARVVPVFAACRLWGLDRFEEQALALLDHAWNQARGVAD